MHARRRLGFVALAALALTLTVSLAVPVRLAYRSPSLHVAVETAAAVISMMAAQLVYGRFRRSLERADLLLTAALVLFAGVNLLFSAAPVIAARDPGSFATWAPAAGGALATGLFTAAAFAAPRPIHRPDAAARRLVALCVLALLVIAVGAALAAPHLPRAVRPTLSPEAPSPTSLTGPPSVLVLQLVLMALLAAAAVGFARRAERTHDALMLWFAIGATLAAFARLNYFLFPTQYSEYFYTGDALRLGFFMALMLGGAREIGVAQREMAQAAVLEERRRLAREIHDGMAQDLAFIVQQGTALVGRRGGPEAADMVTAARRALHDSRGAIAALVRPPVGPLSEALTQMAEEVGDRWGVTVESHVLPGVELPASTRESLLRIVGEAVSNAARHGHARRIRLELSATPELCLSIADDGAGFEPSALPASTTGGHGIVAMRERAEGLGGQLRLRSRPGEGTEIVVLLP